MTALATLSMPLPAAKNLRQDPPPVNTGADKKTGIKSDIPEKISTPVISEEKKVEEKEEDNRTEPQNTGEKLALKLYDSIRGLTDKMGVFSLFEMCMAGLGSILTKGSPYWLSYFGASFVEWTENKATSNKDYAMPKPVTGLFNWLCKLWGVKDKQGERLTWDKALAQGIREKVIGTFNASLSLLTFAYSASKPLLAMAGIGSRKASEPGPLMRKINFISKAVLPIINALLMWSSSAGKALLGHALSGLPHPPKVKVSRGDKGEELESLDVSGHLQSANEDTICGLESSGLMVGHVIDRISPKLGKIYDTVLGLTISIKSFLNGREGMKGEDGNEGNTPLTKRYPLGFLNKGASGQFFYGTVAKICKWMGLELPSHQDLLKLIKSNNETVQEAFLQKLNGQAVMNA